MQEILLSTHLHFLALIDMIVTIFQQVLDIQYGVTFLFSLNTMY